MNVEMLQLARDVSVANCWAGRRHLAGGTQVIIVYMTLKIVIYSVHYNIVYVVQYSTCSTEQPLEYL